MNLEEPIPEEVRALLTRYHFDRVPFAALRDRTRPGADLEAAHRITRPVSPPPEGCASAPPPKDSDAWRALRDEGEAALARGELGAVVLSGGMATRFGSVVKALAPLFDEKPTRFLDAKLADLARYPAVDTTLMTSFATDATIREALVREERHHVHVAAQFISLRLTPDGSLFLDDEGLPSPYASGHGDLPDALAAAGAIARLRSKGVRTLLVSNVDNVGATVDPVLFAMHRRSGKQISVELVEKEPGDKGGLPVFCDGRLVLAEAFRLPKGFPADEFPLFNTNTLWIDLEALEGLHNWTWCVARKKVDGRDAIQWERLVGELTWWHSTNWFHVPRKGAESRFIPVKDLHDLHSHRDAIEAVLTARIPL